MLNWCMERHFLSYIIFFILSMIVILDSLMLRRVSLRLRVREKMIVFRQIIGQFLLKIKARIIDLFICIFLERLLKRKRIIFLLQIEIVRICIFHEIQDNADLVHLVICFQVIIHHCTISISIYIISISIYVRIIYFIFINILLNHKIGLIFLFFL